MGTLLAVRDMSSVWRPDMKNTMQGIVGIGLVAAALAVGCGPVDAEPVASPGAELSVGSGDTQPVPICPSGQNCADISADGNITHIFVDTPCSPDQIMVLVDGVEVSNLHEQGGPCHDIEREVWFPLTGNQQHVTVCVAGCACTASEITIGYKVRGDCSYASVSSCGWPVGR